MASPTVERLPRPSAGAIFADEDLQALYLSVEPRLSFPMPDGELHARLPDRLRDISPGGDLHAPEEGLTASSEGSTNQLLGYRR